MGHTVGKELPGNSVHSSGHAGKGGGKAHIANVGAHRGVLHRDGGHRVRGHIHGHLHIFGSALTDAVLWRHTIGKLHGAGGGVHQVLAVHGRLVRAGRGAGDTVRDRLCRQSPAIFGAGRSRRGDHEGAAGADVLRLGSDIYRKVVFQAHCELGGGCAAVHVSGGHHINSSVQTGGSGCIQVIDIRQVHLAVVGGGRILISIDVGNRRGAARHSDSGFTVFVDTGGAVGRGGHVEVAHGDGAREGLHLAGRGLVAGGRDGEVVAAHSRRRAGNGGAGESHTRSSGSVKCQGGIRGRDDDVLNGGVQADILREGGGRELHGVVHHHGNAGGAFTTVLIADSHCIGAVAGCRRGGGHGGRVAGAQRGGRCPAVSGRARGVAHRGGQLRSAA